MHRKGQSDCAPRSIRVRKEHIFRSSHGEHFPRDGGKSVSQAKEVAHLKRYCSLTWPRRIFFCPGLLSAKTPFTDSGEKDPSASDIREAEELFELLGLSGSGGPLSAPCFRRMAQRCTLARTILFRTPIVLLDEPFSAVDAITRQTSEPAPPAPVTIQENTAHDYPRRGGCPSPRRFNNYSFFRPP